MNTFARVSSQSGIDTSAILMSVADGYDAERALEEAEYQATRHREALLELGRRRLVVRAGERRHCARCHQPITVSFGWPANPMGLCGHCVRIVLGSIDVADLGKDESHPQE